MQPHAVAVVASVVGLRLAEPDLRLVAEEVPDRLAALALYLADPVPSERAEQLAVERQAALDRGDDDVDVMDPHPIQRGFDARRASPAYHARPCTCFTTTW
jgi:hypothetical protein